MTRWLPKELVEAAVVERVGDDLTFEEAWEACGIANGLYEMKKRPGHVPESAVEAQAGVLMDRFGLDWEDIESDMRSLHYGRRSDETRYATLNDLR